MTEEIAAPAAAPATEPTPTPETAAPAAPKAAPAPATPTPTTPAESPALDPDQYLDLSDRKKARAHPWVSGLIGHEVEQARRAERDRLEAERGAERRAESERSAQAERQRLRDLRKSDPYAYAEEMEAADAAHERDEESAKLRGSFARRIGEALQDIPEWAERPEDLRKTELAAALAGKGDDEALSAFVTVATKLVSGQISQKQFDARVAQMEKTYDERLKAEVAREREAIRKEEAARHLAADRRPDLGRGTPAPARRKIDTMSPFDPDFDREYERTVLAGR